MLDNEVFGPVFGAGGHVEASSTPVHPTRLARVDRGLASGHHGLAQADGQLLALDAKYWKL